MSHEKSDVNVRPIRWVVVGFIVTMVVVYIGVWRIFSVYRGEEGRRDVRRSQVQAPSAIPPAPRLQADPYKDWREYRQAEQRILDTYGWASRDAGRVRVPIRLAMELMVKRENKQ
jgi:hypothetical protein